VPSEERLNYGMSLGMMADYAGSNEDEFFACSYATYMGNPVEMEQMSPDLYNMVKYRLGGYESPWKEWIKLGKIPTEI
jgi:hypothetical protein